MFNRTFAIAGLIVLLALSSTAMGAKPGGGGWWSPGDELPTGDGGPTTLPTGVTYCGTPVTFDLFAGQHTDVGSVTIVNDETTLYVTYQASGANLFDTIHLWLGTDLMNLPATPNGQPTPGHFPLSFDVGGAQSHTFEIELGTQIGADYVPAACGTDLFVVAHAEVRVPGTDQDDNPIVAEETAFGGDTPGDGPRWWYYMDYSLQCCDGEEPQGSGHFETAFAKGDWVWTTGRKSNPEDLQSLRMTKNRWGWAINLTTTGTTTYDVWAGAGLNDTDKGALVGTVTVTWDGSNAQVSYALAGTNTMSETHVYAGDEPPTTIAPGQYGHTGYFDPYASSADATLPVEDTDGDGIWIVAHAVVFVID